ncbi:MAG: acylneuraminate cytidylyltransferase family protein [Bacteroidia bacterium]
MADDILFLIAARSGSKGVPNKNIRKLFGIPLLALRGLSALTITNKDNVWVSTDSEQYAAIAMEYGITVPFIRPDFLAADTSSSIDVVLHAIEHARKMGRKYNIIVLLEPTSPFIYKEHLSAAINTLRKEPDASAIVATKRVETATVFIQPETKFLNVLSKNISNLSKLRRQDFGNEVTPSGGFYISRWNDFIENKTFYTEKTLSYIVSEECSLEIDSPLQFKWAEFLVQEKIVDLSKII